MPSDDGLPQRLQILHISQNGLTARSLAELAVSIEAAGPDLEDLDVSKNLISVADDQDVRSWETFLRSFAQCRSLRRLNLSNNDFNGSKAMEILARVYFDHFKVNAAVWEHSKASNDSIRGIEEDGEDLNNEVAALSVRDPNISTKHESPLKLKTSSSVQPQARGIPSIRCVGMLNCRICDSGALFLSYVVERHRWTQNTVCKTMWGPPQDGYSMIATEPNEELSPTGTRILSLAESVPYHPFDTLRLGEEELPLLLSRREASTQNENR